MKKVILFVLGAAMISSTVSAQLDVDSAIGLVAGEVVEFEFVEYGETFSYYFDVEEENSLITLITQGNIDTYLNLYSMDDIEYSFKYADDIGDDLNARLITLIPEAGRYYVELGSYGEGFGEMIYDVGPIEEDPAEYNDDEDSAFPVEVGEAFDVYSVYPQGDVDYFVISLGEEYVGERVVFQTYGDMDLVAQLIDGNNGRTIADSDDDGDGFNPLVEYYVEVPKDVYFVVSPLNEDEMGIYELSVDLYSSDF